MSIESGLQQILDAFGIHLDEESFNNLLSHLPLQGISAWKRVVLGAALGVVAGLIRKWLEDRARAAVAAQAVVQ